MKEIDSITIDTGDKNSEVEEVGKTVNYNFIRKKGKSISMRRKQQKESMQDLHATDEGKERNRETAKQGMSDIHATDQGKERNRETAKQGIFDIRAIDEGKERNHRIFLKSD